MKSTGSQGLAIVIIMIIMTAVMSNLNWNRKYHNSIIRSDAKGYYAYLPAIFIYHDLNFSFFDKIEKQKYYNKHNSYDYRSFSNGKIVNKYYSGTALAQLPFFLGAHLYCGLTGHEQDGYVWPYPVAITIATLFYLMLGLVFLRKTLRMYRISETGTGIILFSMVFGTNVFYYTVGEPGMTHIYSFAFFSIFVFLAKKFFTEQKAGTLFMLAMTLGMIMLIRPVNGLILLSLPFLAGSVQALKKGLRFFFSRIAIPLVCLILIVLMLLPQFIIYKIATGSFFIYSYPGESFNFLKPHISDFLFSYRKGFFLYTPLVFIFILAGSYFLLFRNRFALVSFFVFFLTVVYVFSSWWSWWYGGSFSQRPMVEFMPFFAIMGGIAWNNLRARARNVYLSVILILVIICQVQIFQYRYYHIHWEDMTKEKYWDVFMRADRLL